MADEELLKGEEEEDSSQAEEEITESADSASPEDEETTDADSSDVMADTPVGETESESMDDVVEKQMLEELERLDQEEEPDVADTVVDDGSIMSDEDIESSIDDVVEEKDIRQPDFPSFGQSTTTESEKNLELLMDVNLPISIELGRTTLRIKDILALGPGSVVELKKLAGEPVDLLVNNRIVAKGEVVVVDENFGLRITSLLSPEERLRSLE